ncbi:Major facilitator superfamily domain containing protein [Tylopilus felleus]
MSFPNEVASEATVLLRDFPPSSEPSRRLSPETFIIPVALATKLATQIQVTTLIDLVRKVVCRIWNASHGDPATLPSRGISSPELLCDAPEIAQHFSTVITILGAIEGLVVIAACGLLSRVSLQYGRKSALLIVLVAGIMGNCMIPWSQYMPNWLANWVFLVGMLFELFSGSLPYTYVINLYIVDVCVPEDRTAALSKVAGWAALGTCISYALGGFITTKTGNPLIVFYAAAAILAVTLIYVIAFLPESFSEEKRNAASRMLSEPSMDGSSETTRFASLHIFEPLKMLIPTRSLDGTRNWRLVWCAVHLFLFMAANAYIGAAWLVLATSKYHLTPAETGLFLTIVAVSSTIVLMAIVPSLVRFLRPYYRRKIIRSLLAGEDVIHNEALESEASDRLDVHLAFMSCVAAAVFYLSAAASKTSTTLIFSAICIGLVSIHTPTTRSLVAGSVDPLKQGEALAAIEMVSNAGVVLSPIVMGSILTATIGTTPLLVFYVHLVVVLVSSALLFLVRDADRYQKPHEE